MRKKISKKCRRILNAMQDKSAYIKLGKIGILTSDRDRMVHYIDSYSIYLDTPKGIDYITNIDADDTKTVIDCLVMNIKQDTKQFRLEVGNQFIDVPRWAYEELKEQISRLLGYRSIR